jgi:PleD family two-component response regulator
MRWRSSEQHPAIRLMLVDYYMPEIDGISLVRMLRERYSKRSPSSASRCRTSTASRHATSSKGANDFLNQPFEPEELQCRVSHNLEALEQFNNIQESANRDYLTGLYNRRYWFEGQKLVRGASAPSGAALPVRARCGSLQAGQ